MSEQEIIQYAYLWRGYNISAGAGDNSWLYNMLTYEGDITRKQKLKMTTLLYNMLTYEGDITGRDDKAKGSHYTIWLIMKGI